MVKGSERGRAAGPFSSRQGPELRPAGGWIFAEPLEIKLIMLWLGLARVYRSLWAKGLGGLGPRG